MPVTFTQETRQLTAHLLGELDHHAARSVMEALERQTDAARPRELLLDLSALAFTDSSGIAVLLRAHRHMNRLNGTLRVVHAPEQAMKVFRAAGLQRLIRFE